MVGIDDHQSLVREATEMLDRVTRFLVERQVPAGIEAFLGALNDPVFCHMVAIAVGGILVEVVNDVAWRRLPVTVAEIEAMIDETVLGKLLAGPRGTAPYDREALVKVVADFAELVTGLPERWSQAELHPVVIGHRGEGACVLDALATFSTPNDEPR